MSTAVENPREGDLTENTEAVQGLEEPGRAESQAPGSLCGEKACLGMRSCRAQEGATAPKAMKEAPAGGRARLGADHLPADQGSQVLRAPVHTGHHQTEAAFAQLGLTCKHSRPTTEGGPVVTGDSGHRAGLQCGS